ncbi:hypothetical protein EMEDMD4_980029 [Sinorhizobium medicae]|uniref:Uncharacterized protein n=1 Tax=Sinorhizobium medicae TaxID=110321 RepID=A0A508XCB3_9HYPH|nr:hypothetical protein EMEDMD4_980029 [Sinorhizobium medicae]
MAGGGPPAGNENARGSLDRFGVGTVRPTAVAGSSSHEPTAAGGEGTFFFRVLVFAVAVARFVRALLDFAGVSVMRMPFPNVAFDLNHNYSAQKVRYERLPARSRLVPTRGHGGQALPSLIHCSMPSNRYYGRSRSHCPGE